MDLYQETCSLVLDLWHKDIVQRAPAAQPWVDPHVAPMIVEIGRDLLFPLISQAKVPPIVTSFSHHRRALWDSHQVVLPKMNCRDNLRQPKTLVKATWNGFVFAQFTAVPDSVFVPGDVPGWARDIGLRVSGGFWISIQWQHCFKGKSMSIPDYVAQKCCVQFQTFRESYRTPR